MVRCSACLHDRARAHFSRKQLDKKTQKERRCRECIANDVFPSPTIDQLCLLSPLPMGVLETIVACLSPDDQAAMFLMGLLVASQAAAQFFGGDAMALIRSSAFSNVLRSNPMAFNQCEKMPRQIASLKAKNKLLRTEIYLDREIHKADLERISHQLKEDHDLEMDAINARYVRRKNRSKTYKTLLKEEQEATRVFFSQSSNLTQAVLAISRRPDREDQNNEPGEPVNAVTLGHDWRDRNSSRVEWEHRLINEALYRIRWQPALDTILTIHGRPLRMPHPPRPRPPGMECTRCTSPDGVRPFSFPYGSCSCTVDTVIQL